VFAHEIHRIGSCFSKVLRHAWHCQPFKSKHMEGASESDMRSPLPGERRKKKKTHKPVRFRILLITCGIWSLILYFNAPPD